MQALGARASAWGANEVISVRQNKGTAEQRDGRQGRVLITLPATPSPPTLMSHNDVIIMLMRCLDDLIRYIVIGWQVSDIAFSSQGVRRRRRNYFMWPGAARTRRGAPRRVKDIGFTNPGVRRRCHNYFRGPGAERTGHVRRGALVVLGRLRLRLRLNG